MRRHKSSRRQTAPLRPVTGNEQTHKERTTQIFGKTINYNGYWREVLRVITQADQSLVVSVQGAEPFLADRDDEWDVLD